VISVGEKEEEKERSSGATAASGQEKNDQRVGLVLQPGSGTIAANIAKGPACGTRIGSG
jgi:hypothetical protein